MGTEERLAAYNKKKEGKAKVIAKTSVLLDVKPWADDTDLDEMLKLVKGIEMDGLLWVQAGPHRVRDQEVDCDVHCGGRQLVNRHLVVLHSAHHSQLLDPVSDGDLLACTPQQAVHLDTFHQLSH